jgi:CBS domain-containing protein
MKTVADILRAKQSQGVFTITPNVTVLDALKVMAEKNVGALPVTEEGKLVGIISERDYARKGVLQGRSSIGTVVREIMTRAVITVTPGESLRECMSLMTDRHLRHLPVIDNDQLIGLLSIGDIVKETIAEQDGLILQLEQYIRGEYPTSMAG